MNAAQIARGLGGRKSGGGWVARCPGHDDRNPSLSIRDGSDGTVLVHCHAGCDQRTVIDALKALGAWPERSSARREIVATYDYTDEDCTPLFQVVRSVPKSFFQRYPNGRGGWINRKFPRQVLYRLPLVMRAPIVFVTEGEKDSDRLFEHGFVATTNAGGANAPWLAEYTAALRGREVILIPDNDSSGRRRVVMIARALIGQAARVRFLELPGCKDVSDWFDRGHSEVELLHLIDGIGEHS